MTERFAWVMRNEPVFLENGLKAIFGLILGFGWLDLSPQVTGQLLFVASFVLGLYARLAVTPLSKTDKTGERLVSTTGVPAPVPS